MHRRRLALWFGSLVLWQVVIQWSWWKGEHQQELIDKLDMKAHCVFVIQRLWGNHDSVRRNATFQWYHEVSLKSIQLAAASELPENMHVQIHLLNRDVYASYRSTLSADNVVVLDHELRVRESISDNKCGIVSFMRLDSDDMLNPRAFPAIHSFWQSKMVHLRQSRNKKERIRKRRKSHCRDTTRDCPFAMVTGTMRMANVQIGSSNSTMKCLFHLWPRDNFFSQGLTVTLPTQTWRKEFQSNIEIPYLEGHDFLLDGIEERLPQWYRVWENRAEDYATYIVTPLSSHYSADGGNLGYNCDQDYLIERLGVGVANIIWNARDAIPPSLTSEQLQQNTYVKG